MPGGERRAADLRGDGGAGQPPGAPPGGPGHRPRRPRGDLRAQPRGVGGDPVGRVQDPGDLDQHQLPLRGGRAALHLRQRGSQGPGLRAPVRAARGRRQRLHARARAQHRDRGRKRRRPLRARLARLRGGAGLWLARARLPPALGGRSLHPLHRRNHRHAQGSGLAARRRLLRPRRRHRRPERLEGEAPRGHDRSRRRPGARGPSSRPPPSCTAPPSGR